MATTVRERALAAARSGYSISESVLYCRYEIRKPDGTVYFIVNDKCNCPATKPCKHMELLSIARNYWLALSRQPAPRPVRSRRTFSARHLLKMRALAPTMAPAKPAKRAPIALTPEQIAQAALIQARILADFGPRA